MKILTTKTDVDNLRELRQRKAELRTRLAAERAELHTVWRELRADMKPSGMAASVAQSLLGFSAQADNDAPGTLARLQGPLRVATDLLLGGPHARLLVNLATPLVLAYLPRLAQKTKSLSTKATKSKVYGTLRKGIAGLRDQLKRKKTNVPSENGNKS